MRCRAGQRRDDPCGGPRESRPGPAAVRQIGAVALISHDEAQDAADFAARLRDADPRIRAIAACDFQRLGSASRAAMTALVERLPDVSPVDRDVCGTDRYYWSKDINAQTTPGEEAAAALVAIGTESLPLLIATTRAPQWVARRNAVWALGALDADVAVSALIDALGDSDASVRSQVAWALGAIRVRRAGDALAAALKDSSPRVRRQAAWALGVLGR